MEVTARVLLSSKTFFCSCFLLFISLSNGHAQQETLASIEAPTLISGKSNGGLLTPENTALAAAVADGLTTSLALSAGAVESNTAISTSPMGLIALTGLKIGLIKYSENFSEPEKRLTLKSTSAIWGGATVNNIAVYLAAPPPLPIIAGLLMGIATWITMSNHYEEADTLLAASQISNLKPTD